ncbi:MAG: sulfatase-like hydrolase/transferase [Sedimentisphaerales bacterium]|nr:sulfatase-like hydrolase/transferase [Sedimentisphaerales bacterium]
MGQRTGRRGQSISGDIMPYRVCDRRIFLQQIGLAAGALSLLGCFSTQADIQRKRKKPNILFIMVDDLGPEWISCYGGQDIQTPNIDALAEGGMRFTNAYSMPKCTPTRVSLLTGQYPWRTGWINHWDVPRWGAGCHFDWRYYTTFAHILRCAGYATAAAGKWQINDFRIQPDAMQRHGFDDRCMWTGGETGNPPSENRYWDPYIHTQQGSRTYTGRFGTDVFVEFLIDFMQRHRDKPMLLYFPMCLTHGPLTSTPLDPQAQGKMSRHKAMVRYMDHAVGRLVDALEQLGIRENTIVFFTTDNGTAGGITGRLNGREVKGGKGTLWERGCHAPFIVNAPGLVPIGIVTDALTDFTDILPTFAELAGTPVPKDTVIDGKSVASLLLGKTQDSPRQWILSMGGGEARQVNGRVVPEKDYADLVIRDKQYKLWVEDGKSTRLYNLLDDPGEATNLIDSKDINILSAREKLEQIIESLPKKDAVPMYDPTPAQSWDRKLN